MARMMMFTIVLVMLTLVLNIVGGIVPTGEDNAATQFGFTINPTNGTLTANSESPIKQLLFGASGLLIVAITTGIIVGLVFRQNVENFVILGIITAVFINFMGTWYGFMNYIGTAQIWLAWIGYFIFIPLSIGYLITMIEFFRSNV